MKTSVVLTAVSGVLLLLCFNQVYCQQRDWIYDTYYALYTRDTIIPQFYCDPFLNKEEQERFECYEKEIDDMLGLIEKFLLTTDLGNPSTNYLMTYVRDLFSDAEYTQRIHVLIDSSELKEIYSGTLGHLYRKFHKYLSKNRPRGYTLPTERACGSMSRQTIKVSVKDICPTLDRCTNRPHGSAANGCTSDNKCDVRKALPLMFGMLFYKVSFTFVDKFCTTQDEIADKMQEQFTVLHKEVQLIKAFIMTTQTPFDELYRTALSRGAYSDINTAMQIVTENEKEMSVASVVCEDLEVSAFCPTAIIYHEYLILKALVKDRRNPGKMRDLRILNEIDHAKMLERLEEAVRHFELLAAIDGLDENLRAQVNGISNFFKGVATYDEGKASADVAFIQDKLTEFDGTFRSVTNKMETQLVDIMDKLRTILKVNLAEETGKLVAMVAENCNPLKAIFGGTDPAAMMDQAAKVAKAAGDYAKSLTMFSEMEGNVIPTTTELGTKLRDNQNQISALTQIVHKIQEGRSDTITDDASLFLEQYAGYTPRVNRNDLAANTQSWASFAEATCNLLTGTESVSGETGAAVIGAQLSCEKLESTIAEFEAVRENIFDFQFEIVDSLALIIRGNLAKKLSTSIQNEETDLLKADQLLAGYFMTQNQIQAHSWTFCDEIIYNKHGRQSEKCSPQGELFSTSDVNRLIANPEDFRYTTFERTVYIPSRPQFPGDLGYISIPALAAGENVSFQLPRNMSWLQDYDWSDNTDPTSAMYVQSLHFFLPNKDYTENTEREQKTYTIVVKAEPGSYHTTESPTLYKLPSTHLTFINEYVEGYNPSNCANDIDNPYNLCNNLPDLCLRSSTSESTTLMPTVLSRFSVSYSVTSGSSRLTWSGVKSTTTLRFIAKVRLLKFSSSTPATLEHMQKDISSRETIVSQCCTGNKYRETWKNNNCVDCPSNSTSVMGGYYCETNEE